MNQMNDSSLEEKWVLMRTSVMNKMNEITPDQISSGLEMLNAHASIEYVNVEMKLTTYCLPGIGANRELMATKGEEFYCHLSAFIAELIGNYQDIKNTPTYELNELCQATKEEAPSRYMKDDNAHLVEASFTDAAFALPKELLEKLTVMGAIHGVPAEKELNYILGVYAAGLFEWMEKMC